MKIYRIEICVSHDCCSEFWEYEPLTHFITNKEKATMELQRFLNMDKSKLKELVGYFGNNRPELCSYELETD